MVDFRKLHSHASRARLEGMHAEVAGARNLDDAGFAGWLLGLARNLQDSGKFSTDQRYSYDEWAIYRVIPELAKRLDQSIELRATEMPQEAERADLVTWLTDASKARVAEALKSVAENASFRRAFSVDPDEPGERTAMIFYMFRNASNPFYLAAERLELGHNLPDPQIVERRPALSGQYVVAEFGRRDTVLAYLEDPEEAARYFEVAVRRLRGGDIEKAEVSAARHMFGRASESRINSYERISLQDFHGKYLRAEKVGPEPEMSEPSI